MFDIDFVKNSAALKKAIINKTFTGDPLKELNRLRPAKPPVFQLETTNVCNMKCVMCPRTELMERKQGYMSISDFEQLVVPTISFRLFRKSCAC